MSDIANPWSRQAAAGAAFLVACYAALIAHSADSASSSLRPDIDQLWFAARAILESRNPYELIGPGKEFEYDWPLLYPMPAVLLATALAPFKLEVARVIMAALPSAALAYFIARTDPRGLVIFASRAFYANAWYAQWTPLLMLIWWAPALAFLVACKPTTGLAMLAGPIETLRGMRVAVAGAIVLLVSSFVMQPGWLQQWLGAIQTADHIRPWVSLPFGWLLLFAVLRWRTWQGRLILAFAVVPQTTHFLATLPLLLVPSGLSQRVVLSALTFLPGFLMAREPFGSRINEAASHAERFAVQGEIVLWTVLLPALLMVLFTKRGTRDAQEKAPNARLPEAGSASSNVA